MRIVTSTALALALSVTTADAASFNCGVTMCRLTGISQAQCKKLGLPLALNWASRFARVSQPAPSVVVVQSRPGKALGGSRGGHVSLIVSVEADPRFAIVRDNRGTYRRNIEKNRVALVRAGAWTE